MRQMNSTQATAEQPAGGRFAALLEENGLLVIVLGAFAIVFVLSLHKQLVVDGWMAIVSGRWIVQHGLPSHDTLTVLTHGRRWTDEQWLAQVALYGLWRLGGVKLALFVHTLLVTGGLAGAALFARTRGATARSVTWIAIPVLIAYYPVASVMRPQSFAFPLFAAVLWLVLDDARQPSRRVFWTLPLLVLWTNLHGSVVLGAMLVSLDGLVGMVQKRRPSGRGLALLLAPWACVFASPYGPHLPAYYEKILVGGDFKQFVTEWAPTTLSAQTAAVYLIVLGGLWLLGRAGRGAPAVRPARVRAHRRPRVRRCAEHRLDRARGARGASAARRPAPRQPGRGAGAPEPDPLRDDPRRARHRGRRRGGEIDELVHAGIPEPRQRGPHQQRPGRTGGSSPRAPIADWLLWSQPEPRGPGRVRRPLRAPLGRADPADRAFPGRVGNWLPTARGYQVFVLDPRSDQALERSLRRSLAGAGGLQLAAGRGATPARLSAGVSDANSVRTATIARTARARTIRQVSPCELLDGVSQSSTAGTRVPTAADGRRRSGRRAAGGSASRAAASPRARPRPPRRRHGGRRPRRVRPTRWRRSPSARARPSRPSPHRR